MITAMWALKGGQGVSTTTALTAVGASVDRPALLVDLCGDQSSLFRMGHGQEGIAEWSTGRHDARELRHQAVHVTDTLRLLPRGRGPIDPTRAEELLEWLIIAHPDEPVIADAGTLEPESGGEARDHRLRLIAAQVAGVSILVTKPCYLALRRCGPNTVSPTGVVMVADMRRALGPVDIEQATGAPVLVTVPYDSGIAMAADGGAMAQEAWKEPVEQLRGLVVPADNRIKQQTLEATAAEPKGWWDRHQRRKFLGAASWAIEAEFGEHEINEETGVAWIIDIGDKDLAATAEICRDLKPRDWRHWLYHHVYRCLETDYASRTLDQKRPSTPSRAEGVGL